MNEMKKKLKSLRRRLSELALEYGLPPLLRALRELLLLCGMVSLSILVEVLAESLVGRRVGQVVSEHCGTFEEMTLPPDKKAEDRIWKLAFGPRGHELALARGRRVQIMSILTGMRMDFDGHTDDVTALSWSPDGGRVASASADGTVRVWECASGRQLLLYREHRSPVQAVAWSPDGQLVASGGIDGMVCIWSPDESAGTRVCFSAHSGGVTVLDWSAAGEGLFSGGLDGHVRLWHPETGEVVDDFHVSLKAVTALACCPDPGGMLFAAAIDEGYIDVWDARAHRRLYTYIGHAEHKTTASTGTGSVAWYPDGSRLISAIGGEEFHEWSPSLFPGQSDVSIVVPAWVLSPARRGVAISCLAVRVGSDLLPHCADAIVAAAGDGWSYVGPSLASSLMMIGDLAGGRLLPLLSQAAYRKGV
jgi:WD domain, G-beta repeat